MDEFDFVVVGAGSSGGPIVDRLTAGGRYSVLLLEAGPDASRRWLDIPLGFAKTFLDPAVNWKFVTEPEGQLGGRRIYWPRGKVVGGSSAINGMVYIRGLPSDYDAWRQMGNEGWSFDDCLPYFRRLEGYADGGNESLGDSGPVKITQGEYRNEFGETFLAACAEIGLSEIADFHGQPEGASYYHATICDGRRVSTDRAYIRQARARANCKLVTNALAERVVVEEGRATGIAYRVGMTGSRPPISAAAVVCWFNAGEYQNPMALNCLKYCKGSIGVRGVQDNIWGHFFYAHFYMSQAMYLSGEKDWNNYYPKIREHLIHSQSEDGSWDGDSVGRVYGTSLGLLILQLPYARLPIMQR